MAGRLAALAALVETACVATVDPPLLDPPQHEAQTHQHRHGEDHRQRNYRLAGLYGLDGAGISRADYLRNNCGGCQILDQLSRCLEPMSANPLPSA